MASERPVLRLLHTSDLHLGDDINPERRLAGLTAVVDLALERQVNVVLIAGDFFDSSRLREDSVQPVIRELGRLTMPTVIIPGNHDCMSENSIYKRVQLRDAGDHVYFLGGPEGEHVLLPEMRLAIWARGIEEHHPGHRPLEGYRPGGEPGWWRVALTHGHYVTANEDSYPRSSPIHEHEIANLECDYLALGHWHQFMDLSANGVAAFYSGSPSEGGAATNSVNLVILDPATGVGVERLPL